MITRNNDTSTYHELTPSYRDPYEDFRTQLLLLTESLESKQGWTERVKHMASKPHSRHIDIKNRNRLRSTRRIKQSIRRGRND